MDELKWFAFIFGIDLITSGMRSRWEISISLNLPTKPLGVLIRQLRSSNSKNCQFWANFAMFGLYVITMSQRIILASAKPSHSGKSLLAIESRNPPSGLYLGLAAAVRRRKVACIGMLIWSQPSIATGSIYLGVRVMKCRASLGANE